MGFYLQIVLQILPWLNGYLTEIDRNWGILNGITKKGKWTVVKNHKCYICTEEKLSRRLTLHIFPNLCYFKHPLTKPGGSERKSVQWSFSRIFVFLGTQCFQNQPRLVSVSQNGKNLASCSVPPERELQTLARALSILASTANRFHLPLTASKLTLDLGKRETGIEGKRHRGACSYCDFFLPSTNKTCL